jgi:hypothetical protein
MEKQALKEWLKLLPLQKRLQALENIRRRDSFQGYFDSLNYYLNKSSTLRGSFIFQNTRQGHEYWVNIDNKYFSTEPNK